MFWVSEERSVKSQAMERLWPTLPFSVAAGRLPWRAPASKSRPPFPGATLEKRTAASSRFASEGELPLKTLGHGQSWGGYAQSVERPVPFL
jgi:hypothetical protein